MDTCVELIGIAYPIESDLGDVVQSHLAELSLIPRDELNRVPYKIIIARNAMNASYSYFI